MTPQVSTVREFYADYTNVDASSPSAHFSKYQLLYFMFVVLYPLFEKNRESKDAGSATSNVCFIDREGECRCLVPCRESAPLSPEGMKAQELLLAAAALCDEDRMLHLLSTPDWLSQIKYAFADCALGISICDAQSGSDFPIVYANPAMQAMMGYSMRHLHGQNLRILQGPDSEVEQVKRVDAALREHHTVRLALTNYRKDGSKFTNMMALKPVFNALKDCCYIVCVSFDVSKQGAALQELQHVDTILAMLPLVITS
jgi:PAS domain S-box-containing protein